MSSHPSDPPLGRISPPIHEVIEEMIIRTLGHNENGYLKNLLIRYLQDGQIPQDRNLTSLKEIIVQPNFSPIKQQLCLELQQQQQEIKLGGLPTISPSSFLVNALMNEKINEREQLLRVERHKFLLTIAVITLPILTNLLQFALSYGINIQSGSILR